MMQPQDRTTGGTDKTTNASPSRVRQIFALLIGIDKYMHCDDNIIKNLSGCNNDVDDITDFLRTTLHVPDSNITQLRDEGATFAGITEALEGLANDVRITKGDAIVVFYAGHGAEVWPPEGVKFGRKKVHLLAPHDFSIDLTKVSPGAKHPQYGERCNDIQFNVVKNGLLDINLGRLLDTIADVKGDNITVVLDCCHSGSGTRHVGTKDEPMPRGIDLPEDTRLSSDVLIPSRGSHVVDADEILGVASHVLLAATDPSEHAYEKVNEGCMRGVFTCNLTKLLRSNDLAQLTYMDIIARLPRLFGQTPQCEGINNDRIFLQDCLAGPRESTEEIIYDPKIKHFTIHAGDTHGVTVGTPFTVYSSSCESVLGLVIVEKVEAIQSIICAPDFLIPAGACVLWTPLRKLSVFFDSTADFQHLLEEEMWWKPSFFVDKRESAQLVISKSLGGTVCFELIDQTCIKERFCKIHDTMLPVTDKTTIGTYLRDIAHFHWYLNHKPSPFDLTRVVAYKAPPNDGKAGTGELAGDKAIERNRLLAANIVVECFELTTFAFDVGASSLRRRPEGSNLVENNQVTIINPSDKIYGFRITNKTQLPLFLSVFYFDMTELSIAPYYYPLDPTTACLSPRVGSLDIGFDEKMETQANQYSVPDGQSLDVGHMKLFLSNKYVDWSRLEQESPFDGNRGSSPALHKTDCWFTLDIPIIMRNE